MLQGFPDLLRAVLDGVRCAQHERDAFVDDGRDLGERGRRTIAIAGHGTTAFPFSGCSSFQTLILSFQFDMFS